MPTGYFFLYQSKDYEFTRQEFWEPFEVERTGVWADKDKAQDALNKHILTLAEGKYLYHKDKWEKARKSREVLEETVRLIEEAGLKGRVFPKMDALSVREEPNLQKYIDEESKHWDIGELEIH